MPSLLLHLAFLISVAVCALALPQSLGGVRLQTEDLPSSSFRSQGPVVSADMLSSPSQFNFENTNQSITNRLMNNVTFGSSCTTICIRKEIHDLTKSELKNYLNAIRKLMATPSTDPDYRGFSKYEQFFILHNNMYEHCHGGAQFLPWHRALMRELEKNLQQIDPTVCVPYWDESREAQKWWNSVLFSADYYGSYNSTNGDSCVSDGVFAGVKFSANTPNPLGCVYRNMAPQVKSSSPNLPDWNYYNQMAKDSISDRNVDEPYYQYATQLELYHGVFHQSVKGAMSTYFSNSDPIFYAHHGFIDKTWNDFQYKLLANDFEQYNGKASRSNPHSRQVQVSDKLSPWDYTISDVLDVKQLCYVYAAPGEGRNYATQYRRSGSGVVEVTLDRSSGFVGAPLEQPPPMLEPPVINKDQVDSEFGLVSVVSQNSTSLVLSNGTSLPVNNQTLEWVKHIENQRNQIFDMGNTSSANAIENALNNTTAPDIGLSVPTQLGNGSSSPSQAPKSTSVTPKGAATAKGAQLSGLIGLATVTLAAIFF